MKITLLLKKENHEFKISLLHLSHIGEVSLTNEKTYLTSCLF